VKRVVLAAILVLAGCGGAASSAAPGQADSPYALRATYQQVRPPEDRFWWTPMFVMTRDGVLITPIPESPIPLIWQVTQAPLSQAGFGRIVEQARARGLLGGDGQFVPPGNDDLAQAVQIEMLVDGEMQTLRGDPNADIQCITQPCEPAPGTPEAFAAYLEDLSGILDEELGSATPYEPEGYGVLIRGDLVADPAVNPDIRSWPLETTMTETGVPIATGSSLRCLTVRGEEAAQLRAAFAGANELTSWVDEGRHRTEAVRVDVRALFPGDGNPCMELFGVEG
jgi:hypothetical protein